MATVKQASRRSEVEKRNPALQKSTCLLAGDSKSLQNLHSSSLNPPIFFQKGRKSYKDLSPIVQKIFQSAVVLDESCLFRNEVLFIKKHWCGMQVPAESRHIAIRYTGCFPLKNTFILVMLNSS